VIRAARRAGVEHLVQFSVTHPQLEPLLNHQAKLAVEREVLLSRMSLTILQPMHYMQNIDIGRVVEEGTLRQFYSIDTRLAHVDLEDVAEVAARVVGNPHHHFATYELCGSDFRNARELAEIISADTGQLVTASRVDVAGAEPGEPCHPKRTTITTTRWSGSSTTTLATTSPKIPTCWAGCWAVRRRASPSTSDGTWPRIPSLGCPLSRMRVQNKIHEGHRSQGRSDPGR
jgi:uncharacterized protein YbjT (DUF2867 family)